MRVLWSPVLLWTRLVTVLFSDPGYLWVRQRKNTSKLRNPVIPDRTGFATNAKGFNFFGHPNPATFLPLASQRGPCGRIKKYSLLGKRGRGERETMLGLT